MPKPEFIENVHYSRDLERAVLGACILEGEAYGRIMGVLHPDCFYWEGHQRVYATIAEQWSKNRPTDIVTVALDLSRSGKPIPGVDNIGFFVSQITNAVVSSAHLEHHSLSIREMFCERRLIELQSSASRGKDALDKILALQKELEKLIEINVTFDWADMTEVVMKLYGHMAKVEHSVLIGATTGIGDIDLMLGGLQEATMTVIGARPSVGKTAFADGMAIAQAMDGVPVGFVSLETPRTRIGGRLASHVANIDYWRIYRNRFTDQQQRDLFDKHMLILSQLPIFISDTADVNIVSLRAKVSQLIRKKKCGSIIIDFLQLMGAGNTNKTYNREQEISTISRGCKLMSMEFGIPITLLAQLNRESEKTPDKKPRLFHLRESGSIEQDADNVLLLHRDWKCGIQTDINGLSTEYQADVIIAKSRDGELGEVKLGFDGPKMKFFDLKKSYNLLAPPPQINYTGGWRPVPDD